VKCVATVSIGDELLAGDGLDSNAQRLAKAIAQRGWKHGGHQTVGDDVDVIVAAIERAGAASDLVLMTGGLGPTLDDVTREAIARVAKEELVEDPALAVSIEAMFSSRGLVMPPNNLRQALRPSSGTSIENHNGTAPGVRIVCGAFEVISLPGPPRELEPMLAGVLPPSDGAVLAAEIVACGIGESSAAAKIHDRMDRSAEPLVGITFSDTLIRATVRARAHSTTAETIAEIEAEIRAAWEPWALEGASLESAVALAFMERNQTLAVAESCTGGLIQAMVTDAPGASNWFVGGFVTYANHVKCDQLGVSSAMLEREGAVSARVACAMAAGARERTGASVGLSTTGIAGPDGGSEAKPCGTVFIGVATHDSVDARHFLFRGDRATVRRRTAQAALQMARFSVREISAPLLFEVRQA
jgi:nicotinamide-nucleotide amidase